MATSPQLVEQTIRHQVFLERMKTGEANQYADFLREIDRSIRFRLSGEDLTQFTRQRLDRLIGAVDSDIAAIYDRFWDELDGRLDDVAQYEAGFESRSINQVLNNFETVIPSADQIRAAVIAAPLSVRGPDGGKLLEAFYRDWTEVERQRIGGAVRQGFFEGQTNAQIIRAIRGTKAGNYSDGLLAINNRNAEAVVRTAVQHVASVARQETWNANPGLVRTVRWVSTLDSRTTQICRSLDQTVYPVNKGPRPPIHIRCRSTTVAELDGRFDFLKKGATRSSSEGPVSADLTYYAWLKRQPTKFQEAAIGKSRAKLLRDGGLTAERFAELNLGRNFNPLTLDEMRRIEPLAFERANL